MPITALLLEAVMPGSLGPPTSIEIENQPQKIVLKKNWCSCEKNALYVRMIVAFFMQFQFQGSRALTVGLPLALFWQLVDDYSYLNIHIAEKEKNRQKYDWRAH